jgi:branched-chain amino acid transport system substrate-binding protein
MRRQFRTCAAAGIALTLAMAGSARAEIKVGFGTALSGSGASIGIPYAKGMAAAQAFASAVGEEKIRVIQLDDASDPSAAARNAAKLIEEEKVDLIIGTSSAPSTAAMAAVATAKKVPMITVSPIAPMAPGEGGPWVISVPQPAPLMAAAVVDRMKASGAKTVAYIGYSDSWGDLVYDGLTKAAGPAGIQVVANERYARADSSVTAQVLKIMATRPDAVMTGGSGTPGALPFIALKERGYAGPVFGMHSLINPDFIRVGGAAVEGVICPTGPVVVAEQLPESNPVRAIAMQFRDAYQKANGAPAADAFSAYSFDGWMIFLDAAKRALPKATPGTPEFRAALRDALMTTKEVTGSHGVYSFTPASLYGVDERARVLVRLTKGAWQLLP